MNKNGFNLVRNEKMVDMVSIIFNLIDGNDQSSISDENLLNYISAIMPKSYSFTQKCSFIADTARLIKSVYGKKHNAFEFSWNNGKIFALAPSGTYCKYTTNYGIYFVQVSNGHITCLDKTLDEMALNQEPSNAMAFYALLHICGLVKNTINHLENTKAANSSKDIGIKGIYCNINPIRFTRGVTTTLVFNSDEEGE